MKQIEIKEGRITFKSDITKSVAEEKSKQTNINNEKQKNPASETQNSNLENVLSELKISGRYHMRFLLLISFLSFITSGFPINYIFSAENVDYRCKYSNCKHTELSIVNANSTIDQKCHKYELLDPKGTCTEDNFNKSSGVECSEWIYDKPNSLVAEFNLGCKDWKRTLVGTTHSIGFMIGLLFMGPLSDRFGRKRVLIFNTLITGVIGISKSMVTSYWLFIALEMLEPMIGDNYSTTYTMAVEMVTTETRPMIIFLLSASGTMGDILMAFIAYLAPNWRMFLILLYTPAFVVILYIFWLDESLRWLLIKGRKTEAEQIIRKAAKINNIVIEESKIVNLKSEDASSEKATLRHALHVTFSSKKLFIRLILCICVWFTSLFNAYSLLINSVSLEGNKYINFGLVSLSSTAAGAILLYVLTKFKRKAPLILCLTLTGVFCVSQSFVPKGYRWLSTLLYVCGKINSSITIKMAYLYTTELFPTYTRNTMLALCSSLGRIGAILAPLTPLLFVYWSGLPSFLVGVLSLVTASIVTLMPDTSEDVLPDNVKQAEAIGIKDKKGIA
ncbi:unnamed protein product [Arctia plantaginis]|uniref:Major facilitator superfamily (MFS) profile domain-containing protein n=1 Tax=Arctia plantaginis TaxID=874455 RepID=A0A8S1A8S9_ARCPL|nr:unnamed protein product [Arctia plantaginis]